MLVCVWAVGYTVWFIGVLLPRLWQGLRILVSPELISKILVRILDVGVQGVLAAFKTTGVLLRVGLEVVKFVGGVIMWIVEGIVIRNLR